MNSSKFISQKLFPKSGNQYSRPIVRISAISVALGVCVLIWAFSITQGFRKEIQEKVSGFGAHIEIQYFENNTSYEKKAFSTDSLDLEKIRSIPGIRHLQCCASKAGVIQTEEEIEGVVFKGVGPDYDRNFFEKHLKKGCFPAYCDSNTSNDILISQAMAERLHLDTGERIRVYFVQEPVRQRSFRICGIYNTGLSTYDNSCALCDIRHIRKLNEWNESETDGIEILLDDFGSMDAKCEEINDEIPFYLLAQTTKDMHRDMFDWIDLFDQNVFILVLLITIVVCISLISTQLTLILEQIPNIGILKTLGCSNKDIRNIFLYICRSILLKGMLFGNCIAVGICFLQEWTHLLKLNPENYYMEYVPMPFCWQHLLVINIFIFAVSMATLILPTQFVAKKIRTVEAIETK